MHILEVRKQAHMRFRWLLDICLNSIGHRLLRSMVTVVIITLAIAFLTYIMVDSYIGAAVRDTVQAKVERITLGGRFLRETSQAPSVEELGASIAASGGAAPAFLENLKAWSGLDDAGLGRLRAACRESRLYLDFFAALPAGQRVLLVGNSAGLQILDRLGDPANFGAFSETLKSMPSLRLPGGGLEAFRDFLAAWPELRRQLAGIRAAYAATVAAIHRETGREGLAGVLAGCRDAAAAGAVFARIAAAGFRVEPADQAVIVADIRFQADLAAALGLLRHAEIRTGWYRRFKEKFSPADALRKCGRSATHLDWVYQTLGGQAAGSMPMERFRELAQTYSRQQELLSARQRLVQKYGETGALNERAIWLIIVSFMVCAVGIANAMLMTVLERFKEIATMKCLGARNESIATMFMLESLLTGVIGGLVGIVIGCGIDLALQIFAYGGLVFERFPMAEVAGAFAAAFACSLLLALVAAIYPARVAAKMAPMEAMRVD